MEADTDMDFCELVSKVRPQRKLPTVPIGTRVLAVDPGHTTGIALFNDDGGLIESEQIDTRGLEDGEEVHPRLRELITDWADVIVMEEYRVYHRLAKHHAGSTLLTARVIGCVETLSALVTNRRILIIKQPASVAKSFCKDKKLRDWGFYVPGQVHARDAIRHGCYWFLFGRLEKSRKTSKRGGSVVG